MVESSGLRPVTSATAFATSSVNGPGLVTNTPAFDGSHWNAKFDLAAGRFGGALLDQRFQRIQRVLVVEADVEARARLAGNEVDGLVADIDRGEFQMRGRELRAAGVERLGLQRRDQRHQPADRIVGALRIGDMALPAGHDQVAVERAAAADLDGVAELFVIARLAQNAVVEFFAALGRPLQTASACR